MSGGAAGPRTPWLQIVAAGCILCGALVTLLFGLCAVSISKGFGDGPSPEGQVAIGLALVALAGGLFWLATIVRSRWRKR